MLNRRDFLWTASASAVALTNATSFAEAVYTQPPSTAPLPPSPTLPQALVFASGRRVETRAQWKRRREEILRTAAAQMYGTAPQPPKLNFTEQEKDGRAFNGKARRRQVQLQFKPGDDRAYANVLLYTPVHVQRAPVIIGLNFTGNHSLSSDPGVLLATTYVEQGRNIIGDFGCVVNHRATFACRAMEAHRWPVEQLIDNGYGLCTAYRCDIDADLADQSVPRLRAAYPELQNRPDSFGAIGAWAWALSRMLDFCETDPHVDAKRAAVYGWSRLGKAAVWAGATDPRFAVVLSQESGAGGAKLFRPDEGEDINRLMTHFPYWWAKNFRNYIGMDKQLPFDQHLILSAIAPRPLFVASAVDDHLSNPPNEFASAVLADEVYRFLGVDGIPSKAMPAVGDPMIGRVSYQIRSGGHEVTQYDWDQYLKFLKKYL